MPLVPESPILGSQFLKEFLTLSFCTYHALQAPSSSFLRVELYNLIIHNQPDCCWMMEHVLKIVRELGCSALDVRVYEMISIKLAPELLAYEELPIASIFDKIIDGIFITWHAKIRVDIDTVTYNLDSDLAGRTDNVTIDEYKCCKLLLTYAPVSYVRRMNKTYMAYYLFQVQRLIMIGYDTDKLSHTQFVELQSMFDGFIIDRGFQTMWRSVTDQGGVFEQQLISTLNSYLTLPKDLIKIVSSYGTINFCSDYDYQVFIKAVRNTDK